jgi:tetratricopeptide (TPR) repeat protein
MTLEEQATAESADIFAKSAYALGAMVRAYRGDADAAAEALRQSGLMDASDIQSRASWAMTQSACHMAAGRWAEAAEVAAAWRDSEPSMGSLHPGVRAAHVNWAESALRAGDPAPAREYVARNLSLPPALRSPYLHAHTLRLRVLVGDSEHAGPDMRRAAEILRQAGLRFDLMRTLADAAEILPQADPWSATARAEALELAGELGAVVITERLEPSETAPAVAGA